VPKEAERKDVMMRILVATDGSEGGNRAIDYAAARAKADGTELLIVNILGGYGIPDRVVRAFTQAQQGWLSELLESLSAEILTKARERALAAGAPAVLIESRSGDVAPTIIHVAQEKGVSAIVVGKRGSGRVEGLLLGSVSQKLVSLAPLPVTVVP
jgi:nucleotide-binding universal stress UspA family protein